MKYIQAAAFLFLLMLCSGGLESILDTCGIAAGVTAFLVTCGVLMLTNKGGGYEQL